MKILSIGRGDNCNIYLDDQNISRRHAQLRIYATGRMEIVDYSQNGTFINNVRLQPNAPTPVKRDDVVSFAHTRLLDWNLVPDPLKPWRIGGIVAAVLVGAGLAWWGISAGVKAFNAHYAQPSVTESAITDSVATDASGIATMSAAEPAVEPSVASPDTVTSTQKAEQAIPYPDVTTVIGKQPAVAKPKDKPKPKAVAPKPKPKSETPATADNPKAETPTTADKPKGDTPPASTEAPKAEPSKTETPKTETPPSK